MAKQATLNIEVTFETITCCHAGCGIMFAVPAWWEVKRREDHSWWYCPNGHTQHYAGETAEEKLKREMKEAEDRHRRDLRIETERRQRAENDAMDLANSNRALKGVATKLKKRASAGVCPACHRTISQMARHMASKHPGYCSAAQTPAPREPEGL